MNRSKPSPLRLLLPLGIGLILLIAVLGNRLTVSSATPLTGCVLDPGTGGGLGLARWARRLGFTVRPLDGPVWQAGGQLEHATGNCVLTLGNGPWGFAGEDIAEEQARQLRTWLASGNALVVVTMRPESLPEVIRQGLLAPLDLEEGHPGASSFWDTSVAANPQTETLPVRDGGRLTVAADGPRGQSPEAPRRGAPVVQAGDNRGAVLFRLPVGDGAVYLLLDDFAWTNAGLDHGGNAGVLAEILSREVRGGVVGIDEYRHGHGQTTSFLTFLLSLPGAPAALGVASLWGLFYLYGRNVRLRPPEELRPAERRTAREYIDAVARLYERARAAPLVVEAVARRLHQLSRHRAEPSPLAAELLNQAERYLAGASRPARPTRAMRLTAALIQVRKQFHGTRTLS